MSDMDHIRLAVAEMRAADMLAVLRAAVAGEAHWRGHAKVLLDDIDHLRLCDACAGSGRNVHIASRPCSYCGGRGYEAQTIGSNAARHASECL